MEWFYLWQRREQAELTGLALPNLCDFQTRFGHRFNRVCDDETVIRESYESCWESKRPRLDSQGPQGKLSLSSL